MHIQGVCNGSSNLQLSLTKEKCNLSELICYILELKKIKDMGRKEMGRKEMIQYLRELKITEHNSTKFELDNLDTAKLVNENGLNMIENEHGSTFSIDELSDDEIEFLYFNY